MTTSAHRHRWPSLLSAAALLAAGLTTAAVAPAPASTNAEPVTWTDPFDGDALGSRWQVVNPDPGSLAVADGALHLDGQPGDTYQSANSAKNVVVVDVPTGDFTATAQVSAAVAKVYQGAGLIAWKDMDNYVRAGLTYVGALSPSGVAVESDAETGGSFSALGFADRPGSSAEQLRLQRTGDTITTAYWDATTSAWVTAASTTVTFDTTQVGLYALAAQDGTPLPAAFDSFTLTHDAGADITPAGPFVLQAAGASPYLVVDGQALRLTPDQPTASLRLHADALSDGAVALRTDSAPLVVADGALRLGSPGADGTPLFITDAGGVKVVLRLAGDGSA